ncbi:hypothetical protein ACFSC4_28535 [Deinococcus malanensis]|uniref:hypothetical protein n=1 Tax=Deinococcus malanensis TaxID=1706855 RepID=UPI003626E753
MGLAVLSVPLMLFGMSFEWSLLLIGSWLLLISCMLGALHAIVARPASRIPATLLMLSAPVVPFMNTLDDRIWLLLPFALAWIFFGFSLATWRGMTGTHPAVH